MAAVFAAAVAPAAVSDPLLRGCHDLPLGSAPPGEGPWIPHSPILIQGDLGFLLPTSGVTGGRGTPEDPYLISGWDIAPAGGLDGILIRDTTAHVVMRNNCVHDMVAPTVTNQIPGFAEQPVLDRRLPAGLSLWNTTNVSIEQNRILRMQPLANVHVIGQASPPWILRVPGPAFGIVGEHIANAQVRDNLIAWTNDDGIRIRVSRNITIENNQFMESREGAVLAYLVADLFVGNNIVRDQERYAIEILGANRAVLDNNRVAGDAAEFGIEVLQALDRHGVHPSKEVVLSRNQVEGATLFALSLQVAEDILVTGNAIHHNDEVGIFAGFNLSGLHIVGNNIHDNGLVGVRSDVSDVDARDNWWGCAAGPGQPGCDRVSDHVLFEPWSPVPFPV